MDPMWSGALRERDICEPKLNFELLLLMLLLLNQINGQKSMREIPTYLAEKKKEKEKERKRQPESIAFNVFKSKLFPFPPCKVAQEEEQESKLLLLFAQRNSRK